MPVVTDTSCRVEHERPPDTEGAWPAIRLARALLAIVHAAGGRRRIQIVTTGRRLSATASARSAGRCRSPILAAASRRTLVTAIYVKLWIGNCTIHTVASSQRFSRKVSLKHMMKKRILRADCNTNIGADCDGRGGRDCNRKNSTRNQYTCNRVSVSVS